MLERLPVREKKKERGREEGRRLHFTQKRCAETLEMIPQRQMPRDQIQCGAPPERKGRNRDVGVDGRQAAESFTAHPRAEATLSDQRAGHERPQQNEKCEEK